MHYRLVDVLVASTGDRIEDADRRPERDELAGGGHELLNCLLMVAGFAEYLTIQHRKLICADDQGISRLHRDRLRLGSGQVASQLLGAETEFVTFVDIRRHGLEFVEKAIEQAAPIRRCGGQNDAWGRRILHKINCLARNQRSLPGLLPGAHTFAAAVFDRRPVRPYHARAMGNPLRDRRTPAELAACGQVIDFKETITDFARLAAIVEADLDALDPAKMPPGWRDAEVCGRLEFGFADAQSGLGAGARWPVLQGTVTVTIDAVCQRCLEPFQVPLIADLRLLLTTDTSTSVAEGGCEVWELEEDTLRPLDLVDEALVMALPFATMHVDDATCHGPEVLEEESGARIRPFAGLKSQMEQDD